MSTRHPKHRSTIQEKIEYLKTHPHLLKLSHDKVVVALKRAGLVAPSTYWCDVKPKLLIKEAEKKPAPLTGGGRGSQACHKNYH